MFVAEPPLAQVDFAVQRVVEPVGVPLAEQARFRSRLAHPVPAEPQLAALQRWQALPEPAAA
jgi:hypothetical protein